MDPFPLRRPESDKYCYTGICREGERGGGGNSAGGHKRLHLPLVAERRRPGSASQAKHRPAFVGYNRAWQARRGHNDRAMGRRQASDGAPACGSFRADRKSSTTTAYLCARSAWKQRVSSCEEKEAGVAAYLPIPLRARGVCFCARVHRASFITCWPFEIKSRITKKSPREYH